MEKRTKSSCALPSRLYEYVLIIFEYQIDQIARVAHTCKSYFEVLQLFTCRCHGKIFAKFVEVFCFLNFESKKVSYVPAENNRTACNLLIKCLPSLPTAKRKRVKTLKALCPLNDATLSCILEEFFKEVRTPKGTLFFNKTIWHGFWGRRYFGTPFRMVCQITFLRNKVFIRRS